jgi:phosphoribosylaminoimidazole carboxylase (NCAIR synthetase)
MLSPGATIGILGGGQLGRMTALAAARLGYRCHIFTDEDDSPAAQVSAGATVAAAAPVAANPLVSKGKEIYDAQSCNACHGDAGVGTAAAPKLTGTGERFSADQLATVLKAPTPKMVAGGMSPLDLPADQMSALVAYLEALK